MIGGFMPNIRRVAKAGRFGLSVGIATVAVTAAFGTQIASADGPSQDKLCDDKPVTVRILTPKPHDNAGVGGLGWIVNLAVEFPGGPDGLKRAGFTAPQLTGPGGHDNIPPFPGEFGPGKDD